MKIQRLNSTLSLVVLLATLQTSIVRADDYCPGLYLKAETGYSFSTRTGFSVGNGIGWLNPGDDFSHDIGNSWLWGLGVGYRFTPLLRADISYDKRNNFEYDKTFVTSDRHREFDITDQTLMANLYLDANGINCVNFGRFDPYIGAGIGVARNAGTDFTSSMPSTGAILGSPSNTISAYDDSINHFAWQFTLGSAISLAKNWDADIGYRYVDIGKVEAGPKIVVGDPPGFIRDAITSSRIGLQDAYIDLRYSFS